jgi:5-methylcytosine-specific restriction endonuclease McrA
MGRRHRLLLAVAETDRTCELRQVRGRELWVGRCVHCRRAITVPLDPREPASATLEHIVPRTHGGDDSLENLALACASCNHAKGRQLDCRRLGDETLQRVITELQRERRARMRAPLDGGRR